MLGIEGYLKNQRIAQHWFKSELSLLLFQLIDEFRTVLLHAHLQNTHHIVCSNVGWFLAFKKNN
jgi:hypothetical protein